MNLMVYGYFQCTSNELIELAANVQLITHWLYSREFHGFTDDRVGVVSIQLNNSLAIHSIYLTRATGLDNR